MTLEGLQDPILISSSILRSCRSRNTADVCRICKGGLSSRYTPGHNKICMKATLFRFGRKIDCLVGIFLLACWADLSGAGDSYSPYADRNYPENLYWGDTHLHTSLSFDANFSGNYKVGPEEAYRLARGETITGSKGNPVRLVRPLDFLVIADHAHNLGLVQAIWNEDPRVMSQSDGKRWLEILREARRRDGDFIDLVIKASRAPQGVKPLDPSRIAADTWQESIRAADDFNDPGRFTAFIGYEWTSMIRGNNLHRVVIFRDSGERVSKVQPFSMADSTNPEDLWRYLEGYEKQTGGSVLAIPHNGNVSNGMMFSDRSLDGQPLSPDYARRRARWEPLYETTQIKGDAETHFLLSPEDPFADYETWDKGNVQGSQLKEPWMLQYEYARSALKLGLKHEAALGVNPFGFGLIGSTDSHTGMPAVREENMMGKFAVDEPSAGRARKTMQLKDFAISKSSLTASGYAGVWARENTRASIFDAMQRREVYATTGSRMVVRFFGGWNFKLDDHTRADVAAVGYAGGVPMGDVLHGAPPGKSPRFLIATARDPDGANLERLQVVKGWLDATGEMQEKVYDVALSGQREAHAGEIAEPAPSTVDIEKAVYTNSVGDAQLGTVWEDPDFDPALRAFYYLRVLEIFTPRWTTYDAAYFQTDLPEDVPSVHQERAYTSPIWYSP